MADKKPAANDRKVTTPKFRVSFPWVFEPQPPMEGSADKTPKYGVSMLFDEAARKTPEYKNMLQLAVMAGKEKFGEKFQVVNGQWPAGFKNPFRKGEEKPELEGYGPGVVFCNATSKMKPGLVGADLKPLMTAEEFYAGCYARATIVAYAYDKAGNKGVAFGLNNLQKLGDGESFSGRVKAEDDFESFADPFAAETPSTDADFLG